MNHDQISRRDFIRAGTAVAAGVAFGLKPAYTIAANNPAGADTRKILNYNPDMEYRRCGKTNWMVSAVCLGGHWKRVDTMVPGLIKNDNWMTVDLTHAGFNKNRHEVVTRCLERGINYLDACVYAEMVAYSKALKGRRDKMYLGWSWPEQERRYSIVRSAGKLMEAFDASLRETGEDYVDLWRITAVPDGLQNPDGTYAPAYDEKVSEEIAKALEQAKKSGRARATGVSSHHRPWLEYMMKTYPEQIDVVVTPYTAKSKVLEKDSFFDTVQACDCGFFGIKPFSSNTLFKGNSSPNSSTFDEDNRLARLALRYILCNPAITAPIPGLISLQQVDNMALAVMERRELDRNEKAELDAAMSLAWANLPPAYQWLKNWEYV